MINNLRCKNAYNFNYIKCPSTSDRINGQSVMGQNDASLNSHRAPNHSGRSRDLRQRSADAWGPLHMVEGHKDLIHTVVGPWIHSRLRNRIQNRPHCSRCTRCLADNHIWTESAMVPDCWVQKRTDSLEAGEQHWPQVWEKHLP